MLAGMRYPITAHDIRRVCVAAYVDERTVRAYLRDPSRVRQMSAERIQRALRLLSLDQSTPNLSELVDPAVRPIA